MKYPGWFILLFLAASCSRGGLTRVSGTIEEAGKATIYLDEQELTGYLNKDSVRLKKDGSFKMKDRITVPTFYNLHLKDYISIPLLLNPGDNVIVRSSRNGFTRNYTLEGSEESLFIRDLNRHMTKTKRSLDSLNRSYANAGPEQQESIKTEYSKIYLDQRTYNITFILNHLTSMAAIFALYQQFDENNLLLNTYRDVQLHKITAAALDTIWPESEYVQSLKRDAAQLEQEIRNRNLKQFMDAQPATHPEIRLPNPAGDTIALSSLAGKVIILSFWASWDETCVDLNLQFRKLYGRYHDRGLEIYQVSFDSVLEPWIRTIRYDELPWINVSELSYPESYVAGRYNVTEIPTFYLLDRDGEIIGKNFTLLELDRKIYELLQKKPSSGK